MIWGLTCFEHKQLRELERENRELRRANEILRKPPLFSHKRNSGTDRSDSGSLYVSIQYTDLLAAAGVEASIGSVGAYYDNALAETFIGLYKTEVIRACGPWKTLDDVEYATLEWVDWFNRRRLLAPIGNVPPAEY